MAALQGWHPGELAIQRKLGFADAVKNSWTSMKNFMPEQHRIFHTSHLPFIPVTTLDRDGRPWASVVAGPNGSIGFVQSPDDTTLSMYARIWDGDPLLDTVKSWGSLKDEKDAIAKRSLTAGLGIEFSTRRRNKFAGRIQHVEPVTKSDYHIGMTVTETTGNCPKYINVRKFVPYPETRPVVAYRKQHLLPDEGLPDEVVKFILEADTAFIASVYYADEENADKYPSHAGMNARGGLPGFIRVRPSDGRTVVIPDYSGNRFASSLGNIESSGLAGLTIASFTSGDILYLTGIAENHVGPSALKMMTRHASLTTLEVTGYTFVRDALPVRQQPGTSVERSPYSPKVKYLVEEAGADSSANGGHKASLQEALRLSADLAVFKFKVTTRSGSPELKVRPGQAIALDFMDWIGPPRYQHMADAAPESINDDRVRTWTVSSAHESMGVTWFELTMRKRPGGAVTGALFNKFNSNASTLPGQKVQFDGSICVEVVGVIGDFFMSSEKVNALWIAGGIGITPFLSMLCALEQRGPTADGDVLMVLSTREPDIMLHLIQPSLAKMSPTVKFSVEIFTRAPIPEINALRGLNVKITFHRGRVGSGFWDRAPKDKDVFICGPNEFGDSAVKGFLAAGVKPCQIHREGFY
ncbi:uncharacterized protein N7458_005205 [Penicillium daleae]|uniref:FAD-binding FR-type domain-containing protein n=1 Tax=Penicillium daleae TaxID=63821 RepID=A0AAD6C9U9_9EURO|nr:uncharacterized protein N7458_005205 [Penicillium daleae]KAJ5454249.1 hypothetical protein N7458_005205 [Penicillium daleae]